MQKLLGVAVLLCVAVMPAVGVAGERGTKGGGGDELPSLLGRLGDSKLSADEKRKTEERIIAAGKDAIPVLIAHVNDPTTAWTERAVVNMGEVMNQPPSLHGGGAEPRYADEAVMVGKRCDEMLRRIVTPRDYRSPEERVMKPISMGSGGGMFRVENWGKWWEKNKGKSLSEIQESIKPVIDRWFREGGVEQVVK